MRILGGRTPRTPSLNPPLVIRDKGLAAKDLEKNLIKPPWFTHKKVIAHVVDGIGVLINIFKWKIYDPIIYQRTEHVCPFQQYVDMYNPLNNNNYIYIFRNIKTPNYVLFLLCVCLIYQSWMFVLLMMPHGGPMIRQ